MTETGVVRLPDFLIIGAFKSGTTSLGSYLEQHPQVFIPWLQEPAYFASPRFSASPAGDPRPRQAPESRYGRLRTETLAQYAALFADAPADTVLGESSPQYLRDPASCSRIAAMLPEVKLVAILRQPAQRAFSDYMMFVRDGLEKESFADVVARPRSLRPPQHFVETGFYGRQLQPYYDAFGPDQIRVVLFEELSTDPAGTVRELYRWFGVEASFVPDVSDVRNVSGAPHNPAVAGAYALRRRLQPHLKQLMPQAIVRAVDRGMQKGLSRATPDPEVMAGLRELYADDIRLLATLSGRDLDAWLS